MSDKKYIVVHVDLECNSVSDVASFTTKKEARTWIQASIISAKADYDLFSDTPLRIQWPTNDLAIISDNTCSACDLWQIWPVKEIIEPNI